MTILEDVKGVIGVIPDETIFDREILLFINGSIYSLEQLGVDDLIGFVVVEDTVWLAIGNTGLYAMVQTYITTKTRILFDPSASATIKQSQDSYISELESRIQLLCSELLEVT